MATATLAIIASFYSTSPHMPAVRHGPGYPLCGAIFLHVFIVILWIPMRGAQITGNVSCLIQISQPLLETGIATLQPGGLLSPLLNESALKPSRKASRYDGAASISVNAKVRGNTATVVAVPGQAHHAFWSNAGSRIVTLLQQSSRLKRGAEVSLEELIDRFRSSGSSGEESCHARLLEARHLLDEVHAQVVSLQQQMMAKQNVIRALEATLREYRLSLPPIEVRLTEALERCAQIRAEANLRYATWSSELLELRQIATPEVTLDIARKLIGTRDSSHMEPHSTALPPAQLSLLSMAEASTSFTALHVRRVLENVRDCLRGASASKDLSTQLPLRASQEDCLQRLEGLQRMFTSAYVSLSHNVDVANHERLDRTCDILANTTSQIERAPIILQITEASQRLQEAFDDLGDLESELRRLQAAYVELEQQSSHIQASCFAGNEVSAYLQTIHDIIQDVKKCPGYERVDFSIATFQGFAEFSQDAGENFDTQDSAMDAACRGTVGAQVARASWHHELQTNAVSGFPRLTGRSWVCGNTASYDLMGKCRSGDCAASEVIPGARLCWASGAPISTSNLTETCSVGRRVAACVLDEKPPRAHPQG